MGLKEEMKMKNNILSIALLSAGIVLSLAGCQKGSTSNDLEGKAVRFGATSGRLATRTAFSGEGEGDTTDDFGRKILTWERIDWTPGEDQVMIASDYATVYESDQKYATYTVFDVEVQDGKSKATLAEKASSEELFFTEETSYKFWGIYPASAGSGEDLVEAKASFEISNAQAPSGDPTTMTSGEKTLTILPVDMTQAVMLAAAENQTAQNVELEFYPGFTAFEFTLNAADTELILKELVLSPANTDKSLAGEVAVNTIQTGGATFSNTANYTITYPESKKTTYTFPDNTIISETEYVTFTVFAVPEKIEGLTLEFHMGEDGSEIQTATLKQRVNGEKQDITFTGGKKHCLRGIAVKGVWEFTYLTLDIKPLGWDPVQSDISSGDGVQATQFNIVGADNLRELKDDQVNADTAMTETEKAEAKEANKAYRQWWVFDAGETVTVTYKIMMPLVGTWTVEPCGDTGSFTVTSSTGALTGDLAGEEASATYINLTITSNATGQKSLYLKTSVTTSNGETYSLDSETQLYDMRGYHYFIVNGTVDTEAL